MSKPNLLRRSKHFVVQSAYPTLRVIVTVLQFFTLVKLYWPRVIWIVKVLLVLIAKDGKNLL